MKLAKIHNLPRYVELTALTTECKELFISEARRSHLEKLTRVKDAIIKVAQHIDVTTKPLMDQWLDTMYDDGARKARWTTRGYEQTSNGSEDFFSSTSAMMHLKMMLVDAALKGHVAAIGDYSGTFYQSSLNPEQRAKFGSSSSRGRIGTKLHLGSRVTIPKSQGNTENLGNIQRERFHEFYTDGAVTIRR